MKKKLFIILFLFPLWGLGGLLGGFASFAQTSSSVVVTPITANYAVNPPTVTFEVSWPANSRNANHRAKVWVFVDYKRIQNNAYTGGWLRAGIMTGASSPTATAGSTVSLETGNTKGFWLQGPSDGFAFAATVTVPVTVDLTGYAPQFGWCGVASDRPPYAEEKTGYYILHGTPDFIIQTHPTDASQTVTEHTTAYNDCIYALTDSTGAPGETPLPAITGFHASAIAICAGQSATLTATATNAESYSFDNGQTWQSANTKTVSPSTTTTYILKATRANGACTVTAPTTITITVNDLPVPQSLTADPDVICAGESATLTASPEGAASYRLNSGAWQTSNTFSVNPTATTTYTLYIKSAAGCTASLPNAATVTVNGLPATPTGANSDKSCVEGYAAFYVDEPGDGITIDWYADATGGTALASGTATYIRHCGVGVHTYYAEARNTITQCVSAARLAASVTINPTPAVPSASSPQTFCSGSSPTVADLSATGTSIKWYSGSTGGASLTTSTALASGAYYASQTTNGCESPRTAVTVTVHATPAAPEAGSPQTFCSGSSPTVADLSATGTSIKWYSVSVNGAALTTAAVLPSGAYYASQTIDGCESPRTAVTVTVHTGVAQATITGNASNTCPATTVALTATATGATTFTWYRNGSPVQNDASSAYTVTSSGSYTVQGKNANCTGTTSPSEVVTIRGCINVPGCTGLYLYQATSANDGSGDWYTANAYCTHPSRGARLPTYQELQCMCTYRSTLPGSYISSSGFWSGTPASSGKYWRFSFDSSRGCVDAEYTASIKLYFRCVL